MTDNKEINLAYLAGLFDGEGYIAIHRSSSKPKAYYLFIQVCNTDFRVIHLLHMIFDGYVRMDKRKRYRILYRWDACSRVALAALEMLLPYLIIKKEQAEIAIAFQKHMSSRHRQRITSSEIEKKADFKKKLQIVRDSRPMEGSNAK